MDDPSSFLIRGFVIGLSIAAPVGPIGILCIRRTLVNGPLAGLMSGLGAATADAIYGAIAGYGVTFISAVLIGQGTGLRWVGGIFLIGLGIHTLRSRPAELSASALPTYGLLAAYGSTLVLTLTNPTTILSFAAVFAGLGLASAAGDVGAATTLVVGVFLGSALWWLLLSASIGLVRSRFSSSRLRWVNRISGIVLIIFGCAALVSWGWG